MSSCITDCIGHRNNLPVHESKMKTFLVVSKDSKLVIGATVANIGLSIVGFLGITLVGVALPWIFGPVCVAGAVLGCVYLVLKCIKRRNNFYGPIGQHHRPIVPVRVSPLLVAQLDAGQTDLWQHNNPPAAVNE